MLRTERKTQQLSRLSDPVESCATSVSQSVQQKFWTDGLKSQEATECYFVASPSPARNRNRFNLKRLCAKAGWVEIGPIVSSWLVPLWPDSFRPSTYFISPLSLRRGCSRRRRANGSGPKWPGPMTSSAMPLSERLCTG